MKSLPVGWEGDRFHGDGKTKTFPIIKPIIIKAYQIDVALMPVWDRNYGLIQKSSEAQILAWGMFSNQPPCDEIGDSVIMDTMKPPQSHGAGRHDSGVLFSVILKTWVDGSGVASCVNKPICLSGLDWRIEVPCSLTLYLGHEGFLCDAEMQGAIFYEPTS